MVFFPYWTYHMVFQKKVITLVQNLNSPKTKNVFEFQFISKAEQIQQYKKD